MSSHGPCLGFNDTIKARSMAGVGGGGERAGGVSVEGEKDRKPG